MHECNGSEPPLRRIQTFLNTVTMDQAERTAEILSNVMVDEIRSKVEFVIQAFAIGGERARLMQIQQDSAARKASLSDDKLSTIFYHVLAPMLEMNTWSIAETLSYRSAATIS